MAANKRTKIQRLRDRTTIAELYLKGWNQAKIAEYLELGQPMISKELTKIKADWKQQTTQDYNLYVSEELHRLAMIESEYWQGWQRSQEVKELTLQEKLIGEATAGSGDTRTKAQKKTESRIGDVRFLEGLLKCCDQRAKLLDLYPTKAVATSSEGVSSVAGLSQDAVQLIRSEILGVQS